MKIDRVEYSCPHGDMTTSEAYRKPQTVIVQLANGKEVTREISYPKGDIRNPMSINECNSKFREYAEGVLGKEATAKVIDIIWGMEELNTVANLTNLLVAQKGGQMS